MSVALEDQNVQKNSLKRLRKLISFKLELWVLQNENMVEALKIFFAALSNDHGKIQEKLKIENKAPCKYLIIS